MPAPTNLEPLRVPCPLCKAPIHPIAGRCRHCRADLTRVAPPTTETSPATRGRGGQLALAALLVIAAVAAIAVPLAG